MPNAAIQCAPVVRGAPRTALVVADAEGMQAKDAAAEISVGTRLHGRSGMRQGGTPGALPHRVPPPGMGEEIGVGRMLHVPPATFTWSRMKRSVFVIRPFTENEPVLADSDPTGSTASPARANAGHFVSTLNA